MKVDKMSMAASVEARCPLLDYELLEFAATLPEHLKLRGGNSKWLLKEAARAYLPASIIERPKHPFLLPLKRWLTHSLRGTVREVLARGILSEPGILDRRYVENQLWQQFEGDRPGSARRVWSMLNLGLWAQQNGF
jgi:asparagine synthase (glutamine-hydrolysing)